MSENLQIQIEVEAAKALVQWKAQFAEEVCERAKQLALHSSEPGVVTLRHYMQAAKTALQSLSAAIHDGDAPDAEQRAA